MNGVKHIHCAPYHPASNGLAERFVQTFKTAMKAGAADQQSISHRLSNILLTYRCTPHAMTQEAPGRLFMGQSLRTHLDLLRPSCADRVQSRQSQQKTTHDQHARPRELELGQSVMTRNFRPGSDWVPGVILRKSEPLSYLVKVGDGQVWKRHVDHLRKCGASQETDNREPEDPLVFPSTRPRPMLTHPHTKRIHETEVNQIHQSSQDIIQRADVILLESVKLRNGSCRYPLYGIIMMYCVCRYGVCIAFSCIVCCLFFAREGV